MEARTIDIPPELKPQDGRFGSGPSKVRPEAMRALERWAPSSLGVEDEQQRQVARLKEGLAALFDLPEDWETILGNGGASLFWDAAAISLIKKRSQHLAFGEFSGKFAEVVAKVPFLDKPQIIRSDMGTHPESEPNESVDVYALTHNETTTGVMMQLKRPAQNGLVVVDATSAAGGIMWDPAEVDAYHFAPQKCLASDGGLWIALCSPSALERIEAIAAAGRYMPESLSLETAREYTGRNQVYGTAAAATLFLAAEQTEWINGQGGLAWASSRCRQSSGIIYDWAKRSAYASPFVADSAKRSIVTAAIDFAPEVNAIEVAQTLRANSIVDTEPYRKLGRNALRFATFPSIEPDDVRAVTNCIDYVVSELAR